MALQSNKDNFLHNLTKEGITLRYDVNKGLVADMVDNDGKPRTYSLLKDLGIDLAILPALPSRSVKPNPVPPKVNPSTNILASTKINPTPKSFISSRLNSRDDTRVNREWEVGTKKQNSDDPDEEVKRKGISY